MLISQAFQTLKDEIAKMPTEGTLTQGGSVLIRQDLLLDVLDKTIASIELSEYEEYMGEDM